MLNLLIREILRFGIWGFAAFLFILGVSFILTKPLENVLIGLAIMTMGWALTKVANSEYL